MPKKCKSCRHFDAHPNPDLPFEAGRCKNDDVYRSSRALGFSSIVPWAITEARQICDREGDGHFVFFEPKDPSTGAAVQISDLKSQIPAAELVQITREPRSMAAAGGAR